MSNTPDLHCPDCGDDPEKPGLHAVGCRRILPDKDPRLPLQFGPPWLSWRELTAAETECICDRPTDYAAIPHRMWCPADLRSRP